MGDRILRLDAVLKVADTSRTTIYDWMAKELFPRQIKLGPRAVGWLESEVNAWLAQKRAERDAASMGSRKPEAA